MTELKIVIEEEIKVCNTCQESKLLSDFTRNKGRCKPCRNAKRRNATQKHKPQFDKMKKCNTCKETKLGTNFSASKEATDGLRCICKECHGFVNTKRLYGIGREEYNKMFEEQDGKCKICFTEGYTKLDANVNRFAIDHCHTTGKVRGLLCDSCNKGLGMFEDNKEALVRASKYISTEGEM